MADFTAKIQGILDLTKVESSINKLENKKINLKGVTISKFTLDTSSLPNTIQASLDKHKFTISLDGIKNTNIESTNKSLKSTTSELQNLVSLSKQIGNLEIKIKGLDSTSGHSNQISALKTQLSELKATYNETLAALEANGFNFDSSKVSTSINQVQDKLTELDAKILDTKTNLAEGIAVDFDNGKFDISGIVEKFDNLDDKTEEVTTKVDTLKTAYNNLGDALQSGDIDAIINSYEKYQTAAESAKTEVNNLATAQKTLASSNTLSNQIQTWMNNNKKAAQEYGDELTELQNKLKDNTSASTLTTVKEKFSEIKSEAQAAGLTTDSFASSISKAALQMVGLGSAVQVLQKTVNLCKEAVNAVIELDDALVDLQKTTTASYSELQEFYYEANDVAKEYGATTQEIIQSAADWSRLGYSLDDSELMSQYSSMFSSISPGMDVDTATTGLVSVMKAYGIEAEEVLDGVMSKINAVGNSAATSNDEIITGLQNSAAALAATGSTLDENIALFTAAQEITQDASKVGNALRSISMRIRGRPSLPPYTVMYMLCA